MSEKRSSFSGKLGFVLATAGSAVGLGNIWRFPYLAAQYGGGIFLLVYLVLALTFGFALMCAEIAIGRKTGLSAIGAYKKLDKRFGFVGIIASLVPIIILPYYSVIGGWIIKYLTVFISGNMASATADGFFDSFISSSSEPVGWFLIYLAITALVVLLGVEKGIEKFSKWVMPGLIVIILGIAIYALTLSYTDANGVTRTGMQGLAIYLIPDFTGMTVSQVNYEAVKLGINVKISGNSLSASGLTAYRQSIQPEKEIECGSTVTVYFRTTSGVSDH